MTATDDPVPHLSTPVVEGLFQSDDSGAALVGSQCSGCGTTYFPAGARCRNPTCPDKSLQPLLLGRTGRLYSYTIQTYRPPPLFRMDPWQPYAIGLVEVPEGLRIMSMLSQIEPEHLEIGLDLELVVELLYHDEAGRDVLTYKYAPSTAMQP